MLIWHKFVLFLVPAQEKVGESKEPRFLEDEGFYVGTKPNLGGWNLNKMENRLLKQGAMVIIKSPKQSLGDLLFLLRFLLLFLFLLFLFLFLFSFSFLSVDHELVHGRSQELQDRISWNLVEL